CDERTRCRSTTWPHRNTALLGEMNEIPNNQNVTDESGFLEYAKFVVEPLLQLIIRFRSIAEALLQTLRAKLAQKSDARCPLWHGILGVFRFPEFDFQIAPLGNFQRICDRFRKIAKDFAHFVWGFEIELRLVTHTIFVLHHFPGADTKHYVVCVVLAASQEMDIVCGDESDAEIPGDSWEDAIALALPFHSLFGDFLVAFFFVYLVA